jgi:hypothetical protein
MVRPPASVAANRLVVEDRLESGVVASQRFKVRVVPDTPVDPILIRDSMVDANAVSVLLQAPAPALTRIADQWLTLASLGL